MKKETIIKWLQECSENGSGESCNECPCVNCDDCSGELMKAAAEILGKENAE